jgi:proline iminopeptidase
MIITETKKQRIATASRQVQLYPLGEVIQNGYLKKDNNLIFYEVRGNPTATPVIIHNGGPGGYFDETTFQKFNPKKYMIVCYDQRGCGKSKTTNPDILAKNNLSYLISDIASLQEHLKIDQAVHYGNSFGSTLVLSFASQFPKYVSKIIVSGCYFGGKDETKELLRRFYEFTGELITHSDYKKLCRKVTQGSLEHAKKLCVIESALFTNENNIQTAKEFTQDLEWSEHLRIFSHFMLHDCFTNKKTIFAKLKTLKIPTIIIHGNRDLITPPKNAYELKTILKEHATLHVLPGGHRGIERMNQVLQIINDKPLNTEKIHPDKIQIEKISMDKQKEEMLINDKKQFITTKT